MTQTKFQIIEEFSKIRSHCIFCKTKLKFVFTTTLGITKPSIPLIKSKWVNDQFKFDLTYNSATINVNTKTSLNTKTNEIIFNTDSAFAIPALESLYPHVELQCSNKKCKMNYYLCSSIFKFCIFFENEEPCIRFKIAPFTLAWECFNISKFWVKNDYISKTTDIYLSADDFNNKPIMRPILDFQAMDSNKIENKILTLVNFS